MRSVVRPRKNSRLLNCVDSTKLPPSRLARLPLKRKIAAAESINIALFRHKIELVRNKQEDGRSLSSVEHPRIPLYVIYLNEVDSQKCLLLFKRGEIKFDLEYHEGGQHSKVRTKTLASERSVLITGDYLLFRNMFHAKWSHCERRSGNGRHARRGVRNATFCKCFVGVGGGGGGVKTNAQKPHNITQSKARRAKS